MKEIAERILLIMEEKGMDKKSFAAILGISPALLTHIATGRNNPSLELVLNVLGHFKEISSDWLLFGVGEKARKNIAQVEDVKKKVDDEIKSRIKLIKMLMTEHYRTEMTLLDELNKGV